MANIGVIGAGSWGIALSVLLSNNGHEVKVWSIIEDEIKMLNENHEHKDKLPGVVLSDKITFTTDLKEAVEGKDLLVLAVPSPFVRSTAASLKAVVSDGQIIVNVAKGIEESTLMTLSQIIEEEVPQAEVTVLSGPSHAEEVGRGIPTTIVVGAKNKKTAERYYKSGIISAILYKNKDKKGRSRESKSRAPAFSGYFFTSAFIDITSTYQEFLTLSVYHCVTLQR